MGQRWGGQTTQNGNNSCFVGSSLCRRDGFSPFESALSFICLPGTKVEYEVEVEYIFFFLIMGGSEFSKRESVRAFQNSGRTTQGLKMASQNPRGQYAVAGVDMNAMEYPSPPLTHPPPVRVGETRVFES